MHVLTLKTNLRMPFMREYLLLHGLSDVSRETCIKILNRSILNTSYAERHCTLPTVTIGVTVHGTHSDTPLHPSPPS